MSKNMYKRPKIERCPTCKRLPLFYSLPRPTRLSLIAQICKQKLGIKNSLSFNDCKKILHHYGLQSVKSGKTANLIITKIDKTKKLTVSNAIVLTLHEAMETIPPSILEIGKKIVKSIPIEDMPLPTIIEDDDIDEDTLVMMPEDEDMSDTQSRKSNIH